MVKATSSRHLQHLGATPAPHSITVSSSLSLKSHHLYSSDSMQRGHMPVLPAGSACWCFSNTLANLSKQFTLKLAFPCGRQAARALAYISRLANLVKYAHAPDTCELLQVRDTLDTCEKYEKADNFTGPSCSWGQFLRRS